MIRLFRYLWYLLFPPATRQDITTPSEDKIGLTSDELREDLHPMGEDPKVEVVTTDSNKSYMWLLNAGGGSLTKGGKAPEKIKGKLFQEWEFNRDIVNRIASGLDDLGIRYFIVMPETNVGNCVKRRVKIINELVNGFADDYDYDPVLLSIGSNSYGKGERWRTPRGYEIWHKNNDNLSHDLAMEFHDAMDDEGYPIDARQTPLRTRTGDKEFYLFRNISIPCVQTENGFYTNKEECGKLLDPEVRQHIANAHVHAIAGIEGF